jgi:hypothetical protein
MPKFRVSFTRAARYHKDVKANDAKAASELVFGDEGVDLANCVEIESGVIEAIAVEPMDEEAKLVAAVEPRLFKSGTPGARPIVEAPAADRR